MTPYPTWEILTPTATYTGTVTPTGTPAYTGTVTPTPTPGAPVCDFVSVSTSYRSYYDSYATWMGELDVMVGWVEGFIHDSGWNANSAINWKFDREYWPSDYGYSGSFEGMRADCRVTSANSYGVNNFGVSECGWGRYNVTLFPCDGAWHTVVEPDLGGGFGYVYDFDMYFRLGVTDPEARWDDPSSQYFFRTAQMECVNIQAQLENGTWIDICDFASPTPTPTPVITPTVTPTPFAGGYCCTVECEDGSDDWEELIPVVTIGQGTCIEWGGADLSAIGLAPIPPMRICFAPIRFGHVGILGVSINLDLISVVLSAVVTLRLLWRS